MTVENTTAKIIVNGDDNATTFSFAPMVIFDETQINVIKIETNGDQTDQVVNVDYTVDITEYPDTGSITWPISGTPLASTESLILKRILPLTQTTDLENQGGYFADVQEAALDKITMIDLQQQEIINRCIRIVPSFEDLISLELPEPEAAGLIGWNADADGLINYTGLQGEAGPTGPTGPQGPAGAGTGDMLKTENLSGLANYTTARSNLGVYSTSAVDTLIAAVPAPPAGSVSMYAGASAPTGWLFCDGSAVSRSAYAALFAIISTTYGVGDGSTTFNLPNCKGRMPIGVGQGLTAEGGGAGTTRALAATGGVETHVLSTAEMPLHGHPYRASYTSQSTARTATTGGLMTWTNGVSTRVAFTGTPSNNQGQQIGGEGGSAAHTTMSPFLVLNFMIKT